jgi:hypothetical protein
MLLTTIEWFRHSIAARVDLLLSALILGHLLSIFSWLHRESRGALLMGIFLGVLGVLTKGPVAAVLPAAIVAAYVLLSKRVHPSLLLKLLGAYAAVLILSSLWYLAAYLEGGDRFVSKVWYENVARFAGTQEDEPHKGTVLGLWAAGLVGMLPWSLLLLPALSRVFHRVGLCGGSESQAALLHRKGSHQTWSVRAKGIATGMREWWRSLDEFSRFSLIVVAFHLIFFAIPGSKRSVYLLPAYPFAIALIAAHLELIRASFAWLVRAVSAVSALGILILVFPSLYGGPRCAELVAVLPLSPKAIGEVQHYLALTPQLLQGAGALVTIVAACIVGIGLVRGRIPWLELGTTSSWRSLAMVWGVVLFFGNAVVYPIVLKSLSARPFAESIRHDIPSAEKLYSFEPSFYSLSYYLRRPIYRLEESGDELVTGQLLLVVLNEEDLRDLADYLEVKEFLARSEGPISNARERVLLVRGTWKGKTIIQERR